MIRYESVIYLFIVFVFLLDFCRLSELRIIQYYGKSNVVCYVVFSKEQTWWRSQLWLQLYEAVVERVQFSGTPLISDYEV